MNSIERIEFIINYIRMKIKENNKAIYNISDVFTFLYSYIKIQNEETEKILLLDRVTGDKIILECVKNKKSIKYKYSIETNDLGRVNPELLIIYAMLFIKKTYEYDKELDIYAQSILKDRYLKNYLKLNNE